jgi:hypothetical protein
MEEKEDTVDELTLERLLPRLGLDPADVLNVYLYGSRLWGTPLPQYPFAPRGPSN